MSASSSFEPPRFRTGTRVAGLLFGSLLFLGSGLVTAVPASASSTPSDVSANSCVGTRTVLPAYSEATTTTTSCHSGRSYARHGRIYVETNWATRSSRAYASDYNGATPRDAGWQIRL